MKTNKLLSVFLVVVLTLVLALALSVPVYADDGEPGTVPQKVSSESMVIPSHFSISPIVTETGFISLSIDGLGTNNANGGTIQVQKPAGATVRGAYFAAASTGGWDYVIPDGGVTIDGAGINWDVFLASSIYSYNHFADVTALVKPKVDAAPAGLVDFLITEVNTDAIDGEILAVIFDDPNQSTSNTIVLLFGAQNIAGDDFNIGLAEPLDKTDPNLILDMSLGISYSYQVPPSYLVQFSLVDVNGTRMTSSAGGQDDSADGLTSSNGTLLTVGGIGDTNANPPPNAPPADARTDDELYSLLPFVNTGDTSIAVHTINPSNDDNIFFAALFLASTTAVVGEGIVLAPATAINPLNTNHTVTATVQDDQGNPIAGKLVTFTVVSGPNAGVTGTDTTDANGKATFTYSSSSAGTDTIEASFQNQAGQTITSNQVTKTWEGGPQPTVPSMTEWGIIAAGIILTALIPVALRRRVLARTEP